MASDSPREDQNLAVIARFWKWLSEGSNAWTVVGSTGIGTLVAWVMPFDWKTGVPWVMTTFAMSLAFVTTRAMFDGLMYVRRRINPPSLVITTNDGVKAGVTLKHIGYPTKYWVDATVVRALDGARISATAPFQGRLQVRGLLEGTHATLGHNDWANIILAHDGAPGAQMRIRRGAASDHIDVSNHGAVVELRIHSEPELPTGIRVERYQLTRDQQHFICKLETTR